MPVVSAGPNQYLLVGRGGKVENRGSAVRAILLPGAIWVLVPATKQEATFEFTQETKDGIPLRFKGIVIYRVTDPIAASRLFDFSSGAGIAQITALLTHICLGELRHAVSHMTMVECIEQRKTTLTAVAEAALQRTIHGGAGGAGAAMTDGANVGGVMASDAQGAGEWGVSVEVAQLAQVFIVDAQLRQQLEAEVRNEIKLKADESNIVTHEQNRLAQMASEGRVEEQKLASDRESVRRQEELELVQLARQRRMQAEQVATERQALQLEQERFAAEMAAEQEKVTTGAPVRRLRTATERDLLDDELELRQLQNRLRGLDVEHELMLERANQGLRRQMLPLEQAPQIVEAAARVLQGTNLAIYGEGAQLLGQLAPMFEILGRAVQQATTSIPTGQAADRGAPVA